MTTCHGLQGIQTCREGLHRNLVLLFGLAGFVADPVVEKGKFLIREFGSLTG